MMLTRNGLLSAYFATLIVASPTPNSVLSLRDEPSTANTTNPTTSAVPQVADGQSKFFKGGGLVGAGAAIIAGIATSIIGHSSSEEQPAPPPDNIVFHPTPPRIEPDTYPVLPLSPPSQEPGGEGCQPLDLTAAQPERRSLWRRFLSYLERRVLHKRSEEVYTHPNPIFYAFTLIAPPEYNSRGLLATMLASATTPVTNRLPADQRGTWVTGIGGKFVVPPKLTKKGFTVGFREDNRNTFGMVGGEPETLAWQVRWDYDDIKGLHSNAYLSGRKNHTSTFAVSWGKMPDSVPTKAPKWRGGGAADSTSSSSGDRNGNRGGGGGATVTSEPGAPGSHLPYGTAENSTRQIEMRDIIRAAMNTLTGFRGAGNGLAFSAAENAAAVEAIRQRWSDLISHGCDVNGKIY